MMPTENKRFLPSADTTRWKGKVMFSLLVSLIQLNGLSRAFVIGPMSSVPFRKRPSHVPHRRTNHLMAVGKTGGDVLTTAEEFQATVLQSKEPIMVFFTAPWCGKSRTPYVNVNASPQNFGGNSRDNLPNRTLSSFHTRRQGSHVNRVRRRHARRGSLYG